MRPGDVPTIPRVRDAGARPSSRLEPGHVLGRYVVVRFVGAGGNAEVYAAYDQVLRRTVALKLLRRVAEADGADASPQQWQHVLEEAQALARLSHPNVVAVHDVGREGELVFLAMELVAGVDLSTWASREPRPSWRQCVETMLAAGQGLVAAHAAGIVHGDFKPNNVLVDDDQRARVVDFGLSRVATSTDADADATSIGGTPPYMAPEQHRGRPATAASDQYGFAVTLFELLSGSAPFVADSREALVAVKESVALDAKALERLPARLRGPIKRALSASPEDRFEDLDALLTTLHARVRGGTRSRWGMAAVAAVGLAAAWGASASDGSAHCEGLGREVDSLWSDERRQQIREAFDQSDRAHASATWQSVQRQLDAYADAWATARVAMCEQQSSPSPLQRRAYVLRRMCLDARRSGLQTAIELLSNPDASLVDRALQVAQGLQPVDACARAEVRSPMRATPDEGELAAMKTVEANLARLQVLRAAGRYAEAQGLAASTTAAASLIGDASREALARFEFADLQNRLNDDAALDSYHQALSAAIAAGDPEILAKVSAALAWKSADDASVDEAWRWLGHAEAAMDRVGEDDRLLTRIESVRGHIHGVAGDSAAEVEAHQRMLAAARRAYGDGTEPVAVALGSLAIAEYQHGDHARAAEHGTAALGTLEELLGPSHPRVATVALTVSGALMSAGRYDDATAMAERARAVAVQAYGQKHPYYATIVMGLGTIASYAGRYDEAQARLGEALGVWLELGDENDPRVATARANLGIALHRSGDLGQAREQLERAREIWAGKLGEEHPRTVYARVALADVAVDQGHSAQVVQELEQCLDLQSAGGAEQGDVSMTRFALARALWTQNTDRNRALELATRALADVQETPGYAQHAERIERWLTNPT